MTMASLNAPRRLLGRFRSVAPGATGGVPGLLSSLQAYSGLQAGAARAHRPSQSLGRIGSLEVRVAQTAAEVRQAQKLRYRVFYQEGSASPNPGRLFARRDVDAYDAICDHLLVIDHDARQGQSGRPAVVGTYRLLRQPQALLTYAPEHRYRLPPPAPTALCGRRLPGSIIQMPPTPYLPEPPQPSLL